MTLTPEQKQSVASWVASGDNLSAIQKKIVENFKISMTYMDVRFLVDDLNLALKDAVPKLDTSDVSKGGAAQQEAAAQSEKKGLLDRAKEKLGFNKDQPGESAELEDDGYAEADAELDEGLPAGGPSNISLTVDKVTLIPSALASGTVKFSDGVTGKWVVDNYGRPGFSEVSKPGYRPSPADAQAFMQELSAALQKRGF